MFAASSLYHLPRCLLLLRLMVSPPTPPCRPWSRPPRVVAALHWWLREVPALPYDAVLACCCAGGNKVPLMAASSDLCHPRRRGAAPHAPRLSADLAARVAGREKRPLGDLFGLGVFGVNLTRLAPGAWSRCTTGTAGRTSSCVLEGTPTLVTDAGATLLSPGMCAGFPAGGTAHHLENRSGDVVILRSATARLATTATIRTTT